MTEPRAKWTDERLDDLNKKGDEGFTQINADLREVKSELKDLKAEMNARFDGVNTRFDSMNSRFDAMNARFDSMNLGMWAGVITIVAALIGTSAFS